MKNKGFTLMEAMVVTGLMSVIFAMLIGVMMHSDVYWQKGQNKVQEHWEARHILDTMARVLRESNPSWDVNGTLYNVAISESNTRIDAYVPEYNDDNTIDSLKKITYKLNPFNSRELWFKSGTGDYEVVSGMINTVFWGGSCDCSANDPMNCNTVNSACPAVRILVATVKDNVFNLTTDVTLRNRVNLALSGSTGIEEPEEGEF
ncbi:MAG: type II secretion system protein [Candidatus Omnitrophota bacterium]